MQQQKSVYKTNVICAKQIVLLGQALFVPTEVESKFSIKKSNNLYVTEIYASLDGVAPL